MLGMGYCSYPFLSPGNSVARVRVRAWRLYDTKQGFFHAQNQASQDIDIIRASKTEDHPLKTSADFPREELFMMTLEKCTDHASVR